MAVVDEDIKEIKEDLKKIRHILIGNGEIGLCETTRDLTDKFSSLSIRVRAVEETVKPLDKAAAQKKFLGEVVKTVLTVTVTAVPIIISMLMYVHKLLAAVEKVVPLSTLYPK
jgi:hypothetical protein